MKRQLRDFGIIKCVSSLVFIFCYAIASPAFGNGVININGMCYISNGKYHVEENENGTILLTENAGAWVLEGDDLNVFKSGDSGIYYTELNTEKPYILTDKNRRFYITSAEVLDSFADKVNSPSSKSEPIIIMRGLDVLIPGKDGGLQYVTKDGGVRFIRGDADKLWHQKDALEQAELKAEKEAKARAKAEAKARAEAEARARAEQEARDALLIEALRKSEEALKEARKPRGGIGFSLNPRTGEVSPVIYP
jgi:hypothetical protein